MVITEQRQAIRVVVFFILLWKTEANHCGSFVRKNNKWINIAQQSNLTLTPLSENKAPTEEECQELCCELKQCTVTVFDKAQKDTNTCILYDCSNNYCHFENNKHKITFELKRSVPNVTNTEGTSSPKVPSLSTTVTAQETSKAITTTSKEMMKDNQNEIITKMSSTSKSEILTSLTLKSSISTLSTPISANTVLPTSASQTSTVVIETRKTTQQKISSTKGLTLMVSSTTAPPPETTTKTQRQTTEAADTSVKQTTTATSGKTIQQASNYGPSSKITTKTESKSTNPISTTSITTQKPINTKEKPHSETTTKPSTTTGVVSKQASKLLTVVTDSNVTHKNFNTVTITTSLTTAKTLPVINVTYSTAGQNNNRTTMSSGELSNTTNPLTNESGHTIQEKPQTNSTSWEFHELTKSSSAVKGALIALLSFGIVFSLAIVFIVFKKCFDSWQRRHYSRIDYLVNGMYN